MGLVPGVEVTVDIGPMAHGGFCVARHEGQVLFVRHTVPGERVVARVTEGKEGDRFVRADAVEILLAAPERVTPPCPYAGPGRCGGCDLQHVALPAQRVLKAEVVREQLARLARQDVAVSVEPVPGDRDGLGWRTRVEYAVDEAGVPGLHPHRSHAVLPIERCLLAAQDPAHARVLDRRWPGSTSVDVVVPSDGPAVVVPVPVGERAVPEVTEVVEVDYPSWESRGHVEGRFTVSARGFWQVHPGAAQTFLGMVMAMLDPRPGETALDLYSGVGLFSAGLAEAVGSSGRVVAVESDAVAVAHARRNLAAYGQVVTVAARVDDFFGVARPKRRGPTPRRATRARAPRRHPLAPPAADLVVLDPPRTGAGRSVIEAVATLAPRAIAYVACDPAALARDTAYLADLGWQLAELRAFDAFPMTHHVECLALFTT